MRMRCLIGATIAVLVAASAGRAFDTIKTPKRTWVGRVVGMSPVKVDLEQNSAAIIEEVPVNQIEAVFYEDEPAELKTAKLHVFGGRYAEALTALQRIKEKPSRSEIQQDVDFYTSLCAAKMALGGNGKIADAGRKMKAFVDAHPRSYHFFEASEVLGDLLVAIGQYAPAAEYYDRLAQAPWPEYKLRAGVASGRALLAQGKIEAAQAAFDKVIATSAEGNVAEQQHTLAKLGKAGVLVSLKKSDAAIAMVDDLLRTADPEDAQLLARAYNILGTAQRQAGHANEAILAFLHVDLLYPSVPEAHAEALANLVDLWEQVHRTERAKQARKILKEEYGDSPWAKK